MQGLLHRLSPYLTFKIEKSACLFAMVLTIAGQSSCDRVAIPQNAMPSLELTSSSFSNGAAMPDSLTCNGQGGSPELAWNSPPAGTQSFVLIATDKDSVLSWVLGPFVHWVLYDLPPEQRELPAGIPKQAQLADGSRQIQNGLDEIGYSGPCPPGTSPHRYQFQLFALDTKLGLPVGASEKQVVKAMNGHVVARGDLIGTYHR
jgi:Raf kinase inhibitor-like YbhB/YbcL family protein